MKDVLGGRHFLKMMRKNMGRRSISKKGILNAARWCLLFSLLMNMMFSASDVQASDVIDLDAKVNEENVMKLLERYDGNGRFLVDYGTRIGSEWLEYYDEGELLIESLDMVVHEECHDYSMLDDEKERMYIGGRKSVIVPFSAVYRTKQMTKSVPKECRTFRFPTYISKPDAGLAANVNGAYGLLNEFNAYCWGMNNNVAMYPYYDHFSDDLGTWGSFIANGANNRLAYAEFKYYILHYMYYAKKHYPSVYRKIAANKKFCLAYKETEKHFRKSIKSYEKELTKIESKIRKAGYNVECTDGYFIVTDTRGSGSGVGLMDDEYSVLINEIQKNQYQSIHKKLVK